MAGPETPGTAPGTGVPLGTGLEPVWFAAGWISTHTEAGIGVSLMAADLRGEISIGLSRNVPLGVIIGLADEADG